MPKSERVLLRENIGQLAYELYQQKKITKTTYNQAVDIQYAFKRPSIDAIRIFEKQLKDISEAKSQVKNVRIAKITKHEVKHFQNTAKEFNFTANVKIADWFKYASLMKSAIINQIQQFQKQNALFKVGLTTQIKYNKSTDTKSITTAVHHTGFSQDKGQQITSSSNISEVYDRLVAKIANEIENFSNQGSAWVIQNIIESTLQLVRNQAFNGKSYIPLPEWVANKRCCVNVKNNGDDKCFMWALLSALHPVVKNTERVSNYQQYVSRYDWSDIQFPVDTTQYAHIEDKLQIPFNVFCLDDTCENGKYTVEYKSSLLGDKKRINLLRFENDDSHSHFVWIKNLNAFVRDGQHTGQTFACEYCLSIFYRPETYAKHRASNKCSMSYNGVAMKTLPQCEDAYTEFKHWSKLLQVPFVVYADIESVLIPTNQAKGDNTTIEQEHKANHIGCKLVSRYPHLLDDVYQQFDGEDCIKQFYDYLFTLESKVSYILDNTNISMNLTNEEEASFNNSTHCWACNGKLGSDRVRDHDHLNGKYRGAAHSKCNLEMNNRRTKLPVIFHNLRGYDSHFILQASSEFCQPIQYEKDGKAKTYTRQLSCIPNTLDKYMSFSIGKLVFLDSLQFVNTSLDNLVNALNQEGEKMFPIYNKEVGGSLLRQKGVFPYDWFNSIDKLDATELPSKSDFYSKLNESDISQTDYEHACKVWCETGCKTFYDYLSLYLKTDVVLLADCFEAFRDACLKNYMIDPCHHFTSPGMSWNAMMLQLKREGIHKKIGLFDCCQEDMLDMIKGNMRGGISMISNRYAKANNPYMSEYDDSQPNSYISYLDANNLYGWAMSQMLPVGDYKWESDYFTTKTILALSDEGERGYVFEVDLEYPKELHDSHSDYPLAPEATSFDASPFMIQVAEQLECKPVKTTKLIPNLCDKSKYVVHYRNLKFYLSQGMLLKKVHRVLSFEQSPWLADYIAKNTKRRAQTKVAFEKDLFKLMNNAVFGKTMENVDNHIDVKLVTDDKKLVKLASKPNLNNVRIFNEDLVAVQMGKTQVKYDKPVIVGFAILELSKLLMYNFHYGFIKPSYGDKAKLLFTDTDSLCYHIETNDLYRDMFQNKELFDWCDFNNDVLKKMGVQDVSGLQAMNKKVIGKFKDETEGVAVAEFVGLRAKMYSLLLDSGKSKNTAKGVKKNKIKTDCQHSRYLESLFEFKPHKVSFRNIRSINHNVMTMNQTKTGLSCYDDKRYVLEDNISTRAQGHYMN